MKHIIITGAYGLIGTNLIKTIPKFFVDEEVEIIKVKFNELPPIASQSIDIIIHAAGYGQPLRFTEDKLATININTQTTERLFSYLKPGGKFLFVSTSEVYSGAISPYSESILGTTTPAHPRACYIEGKRCGEAICHSFLSQGFDVKIARLSLAYGPAKLGDTRVLNQFIEQAISTGTIHMRDHGEAIRTYCYVKDAVELMWKILLQGKDVVYNVGGFSRVTISELAQEIGRLTNANVSIPIHNPKSLTGAPDDVSLDMSHTLAEFKQEFTSLDHGLKETIKQYRMMYD